MTAHDCTSITPGCYRCELNQDEVRAIEEEERQAFREKLRYWRENGAPGYIGPRATKEASS